VGSATGRRDDAEYLLPRLDILRLQTRARGHRVEAPWLDLPLRPVAALDQKQESGGPSGQARGGGGLGEMTRRTSAGGFRSILLEICLRSRGIQA
jgi:hypothetical protein